MNDSAKTITKRFLSFWPCAAMVITGGILWGKGLSYPPYRDEHAVAELQKRQKPENIQSDEWEAFKKQYFEDLKKLRTPRNQLLDTGHSLVSLGISLSLFMIYFRIRRLSDLRFLQTPKSSREFLKWINLSLFSSIISSYIYYNYTFIRGDYPAFADSIGIPIGFQALYSFISMLVMSYLWIVLLEHKILPINLWIWPPHSGLRKWICLLVFGVLLGLALFRLGEDLVHGDFTSVPIHLIWLYIWLSSRAAFSTRKILNNADSVPGNSQPVFQSMDPNTGVITEYKADC